MPANEPKASRSPSPTLPDGGPAPKSVLIVQTAFLGDLVLTLPLIEAVHRAWPDAGIHLLANARFQGLVRNHPLLTSVIAYDKRGGERGLTGMMRIVRTLRSLHCDLALVPHRSFRSALMVALAGIGRRIGFGGTPGAWLYTKRVPRDLARHETARNLSLLGDWALDVEDKRPHFAPDDPSRESVDTWLADQGLQGRPFTVIAPGSVWATKRWPRDSWVELARGLHANSGGDVIAVGGPEDRALCEGIASAAGGGVHSSAGELTIPASSELIRRANLLVTGDTAPLHLGEAVRTPVLAIFGPTVPEFGFAPLGPEDRIVGLDLDCRPCAIHGSEHCPLGHHHCMVMLGADRVLEVAREMLAEAAPDGGVGAEPGA